MVGTGSPRISLWQGADGQSSQHFRSSVRSTQGDLLRRKSILLLYTARAGDAGEDNATPVQRASTLISTGRNLFSSGTDGQRVPGNISRDVSRQRAVSARLNLTRASEISGLPRSVAAIPRIVTTAHLPHIATVCRAGKRYRSLGSINSHQRRRVASVWTTRLTSRRER